MQTPRASQTDGWTPSAPVCPNAPRKARLRCQLDEGSYVTCVEHAGEALKDMDADELNTALQHLPRHTLEGVFLAFCHWQAGTHKWPFDSLLMIASDLERQMTEAALKALAPDSSWADWLELVQQASADPVVGQQLAQTFAQSMLSGPAQGAKRKLFD